jgi:hypothetical protein
VAIFGFIVGFLVLLFCTVVFFGMTYFASMFGSQKNSAAETIMFLVITGIIFWLWFLLISNTPFSIVAS